MNELKGGNIYKLGNDFFVAKYDDGVRKFHSAPGGLASWYLESKSNPNQCYAVGPNGELFAVTYDLEKMHSVDGLEIPQEVHHPTKHTVNDLEPTA